MAIILEKGQRINIGLSKVGVGLGWDPNEGTGFDFDLDASAFMLGTNKKIPEDDFFVFYNSEKRVLPNNLNQFEPYDIRKYPNFREDYIKKTRGVSPDWAVYGALDDDDGKTSDGDYDEIIDIDLSKVDPKIQEIVFSVTIHDFEGRRQNFGQVRNSFICIYNAQTNEEIAKYELDEDFSVETAVEFGRLYKRNSEWKFEAMGIGYKGGLDFFVKKYT